ncbi:MAG: hypothetical protein NTW30_04410 [Candidatus Aenigmarchaeota archaeon]|jgi:hypothetical protein|nr:hypothetical protein [Candidatus Aenigmarchaeota archaeon]
MMVFVSRSKHRNIRSSFLVVKFQDRKEPSPFVKNIAVIISLMKSKKWAESSDIAFLPQYFIELPDVLPHPGRI